ncbi:hypothetical protein HD806DRAFT_551062 [Xylariaceae sp. AK1471]|nr:hypothetical protein HD806DRAFT_551062 [Xylariaceae sp. AK1471]
MAAGQSAFMLSSIQVALATGVGIGRDSCVPGTIEERASIQLEITAIAISTGWLEGETYWAFEYSYKAAGPGLVEANNERFPQHSTHKGISIGEARVSVLYSLKDSTYYRGMSIAYSRVIQLGK